MPEGVGKVGHVLGPPVINPLPAGMQWKGPKVQPSRVHRPPRPADWNRPVAATKGRRGGRLKRPPRLQLWLPLASPVCFLSQDSRRHLPRPRSYKDALIPHPTTARTSKVTRRPTVLPYPVSRPSWPGRLRQVARGRRSALRSSLRAGLRSGMAPAGNTTSFSCQQAYRSGMSLPMLLPPAARPHRLLATTRTAYLLSRS
jgi:hypothetical protein